MRREKGITLIALVVTIVVLLILAGISIAMLTGENGIISRATEAKERTGSSQVEEESKLKQSETIIENYTNPKEKTDELKIGDYVEYTYDEAENYTFNSDTSNASYNIEQTAGLRWRVININKSDNTVTLASTTTNSEIDFGNSYSTTQLISQFEELESVLNDACKKHYSNKSLSINARSVLYSDYTEENKEIFEDMENKFVFASTKIEENTYGNKSSYCMYMKFSDGSIGLGAFCYEDSYRNSTWGNNRDDCYIEPAVTLPISMIGEKINDIWKLN